MSPGRGLTLFSASSELHEIISEGLSIVFSHTIRRKRIIMYHIAQIPNLSKVKAALKKACFLPAELEQLLQPVLKLERHLLCWLSILENTWHVYILHVKQS